MLKKINAVISEFDNHKAKIEVVCNQLKDDYMDKLKKTK